MHFHWLCKWNFCKIAVSRASKAKANVHCSASAIRFTGRESFAKSFLLFAWFIHEHLSGKLLMSEGKSTTY
jgi:hypothetical protein